MEPSDAQAEKRRRRPPLACIACRRRKVRCDRRMPCQNCVRARRATSCAYVADERVTGIDHPPAQQQQPASAQAAAGVAGSYLSPSSTTHTNTGAADDAAALAERVRSLEKQLAAVLDASRAASKSPLEPPPPPTARSLLGDECWQIHPDGRSRGGLHGSFSRRDKDPTEAKAMLTKSRYMGSSHWIHGMTIVGTILFSRS